MLTFAQNIVQFYQGMQFDVTLPSGVEVLKPFSHPSSAAVAETFYRKFYNDYNSRTFIIGINPGRLGAGVTGVPFTDPDKLEKYCGIPNHLPKKPELSAEFVYRVIEKFGGAESFYSKFYFTSIFPLTLTKKGLNMNYYDDVALYESLVEFIQKAMSTQVSFGASHRCICLGSGKNLMYLRQLNDKEKFFSKIDVLDHPRFIMQYKRKSLDEYLAKYLFLLGRSSDKSA